jgi:hypothetical protein
MNRIEKGYIPVLPFEIKDVGGGTQAILMTTPDEHFDERQAVKQLANDINTDRTGEDIKRYTSFVIGEAKLRILNRMTLKKVLVLLVKKIFRVDINEDINLILSDASNQ